MNRTHRTASVLFTCLLALGLFGCETSTDTTASGGVILSITDFDGLPLAFSLNAGLSFVQIGEIKVENVPKNPTGITSDLMNVEIRSMEVSYTRADTGSRLPVTYVVGMFGIVPVGGEFTLANGSVAGPSQLGNEPLSDLLFANGGFDSETGFDTITLNLHIRFFGRTLSGDPVETAPASFTLVFTP